MGYWAASRESRACESYFYMRGRGQGGGGGGGRKGGGDEGSGLYSMSYVV